MDIDFLLDIEFYFLPIRYFKYSTLIFSNNNLYINKNYFGRIKKKYERDCKSIMKNIEKLSVNKSCQNIGNNYGKIIDGLKCFLEKKIQTFICKINLSTINPILSFIVDKNTRKIKIYKVRKTYIVCENCRNSPFGCSNCKIIKKDIISTVDLEKDNHLFSNFNFENKDMYEIKCIYPFLYFIKNISFDVETEPETSKNNILQKVVVLDEDSILEYLSSLNFKFLTYQNSKMIIKNWR